MARIGTPLLCFLASHLLVSPTVRATDCADASELRARIESLIGSNLAELDVHLALETPYPETYRLRIRRGALDRTIEGSCEALMDAAAVVVRTSLLLDAAEPDVAPTDPAPTDAAPPDLAPADVPSSLREPRLSELDSPVRAKSSIARSSQPTSTLRSELGARVQGAIGFASNVVLDFQAGAGFEYDAFRFGARALAQLPTRVESAEIGGAKISVFGAVVDACWVWSWLGVCGGGELSALYARGFDLDVERDGVRLLGQLWLSAFARVATDPFVRIGVATSIPIEPPRIYTRGGSTIHRAGVSVRAFVELAFEVG